MAGKCFNCMYVPVCCLHWAVTIINAVLNVLGCVCLTLTCKPSRGCGRLVQAKVPDPRGGSQGLDVELTKQHGADQYEQACAAAKAGVDGLPAGAFADPDFPTPGVVVDTRVTWKRPKEFYGDAARVWQEIGAGDVTQGKLGDCYLLATLSALAEEKGRVQAIVAGASGDGALNDKGAYRVVMYQHGDWVSVPVDDRMPIMQDGTPVFARTKKEEGEVWPMLIEKAWVKAWAKGDYQAVAGGRPAHALHAFTGAPCEEIMHDSSSLEELWASLTTTLNSGGMAVAATGNMPVVCGSWGLPAFCCYPCRRIRRAAWTNCLRECMFTLRSLWLAASCLWALAAGLVYYVLIWPLECCCGPVLVWYSRLRTGLVPGHAYSVLKAIEVPESFGCGCIKERLVCLRNPWGKGEWHGAWSDRSCRWTRKAKELAGGVARSDDGLFWMSIADYARFFHYTTLCHSRTGWHSTAWDAKTRGQQGLLRLSVPADAPTGLPAAGGVVAVSAGAGESKASEGGEAKAADDGFVHAIIALGHVSVGIDVHGTLGKQAVRMCVLDSGSGTAVGSSRQIQTYQSYTNASNTCTTELLLRPGHTYDVLLNWQKKDEHMASGRPFVVGVYSSAPGLQLSSNIQAVSGGDRPSVFVPAYNKFGKCRKCMRPVPPEHNYTRFKKSHPDGCTQALYSVV